MASRPVPRDSISLASDQIFDRNCSVCERKHKIKEAVNYCTACKEYFCQECLDFHDSLPVLKDHRTKLMGKSTMLKSPAKVGSRDTITTICDEHTDKLVELYCKTHDVVCCTICLALKHKHCENTEYIPKIAAGFSRAQDTSKLKSDLQNIKKELAKIKASRQKDQTRLQNEREHVLTQIKDVRRKINVIFDDLEKSVTDGAHHRYRDYGGKIKTDLDECNDAIRRIEEATKGFDDADKHNDSQLFVDVKKGVENLGEFRELVEKIENQVGREKIAFTVDEGVEEYVASLERLGTFVDEMSRASKPQTVVGRDDAMVKMKDDSGTCIIHGSCCLPDGGALLADFNNDKLKRLDASYRVTDSCNIKDPRGVCYIPHTKEAVVCQKGGPVHILSVGRTMAVIRSTKTDHNCYGVSYNNGQLYVGQSSGNKVHVYDFVSGDHKTTIHTDGRGQQIFSDYIRHIATHSDGTRIWVADYYKGLIQLDKSGNLLRTITDDELSGAYGVCLGRDNSVLVCGADSRTVLQLSPDGEKISTIVRMNDLQANPLSICYDKNRARLLVTMSLCDHVKVFHIK